MWESLQDKSYKLPHLIKTIPHSGKLSRKKTFAVLWLSVKVFSMKFGGMVLFGGTREQSTKFSLQKSYFISIPEFFSHTKIKKWVVLTTEWLPWLHGHTSEASCRGVVSLMFPPLFLVVNEETTRKLVVLYS